jgi:hypothetical protein
LQQQGKRKKSSLNFSHHYDHHFIPLQTCSLWTKQNHINKLPLLQAIFAFDPEMLSFPFQPLNHQPPKTNVFMIIVYKKKNIKKNQTNKQTNKQKQNKKQSSNVPQKRLESHRPIFSVGSSLHSSLVSRNNIPHA